MSHSDIDQGRTRRRDRKRSKGFSLIELVIALVVVSILTAISIPYLYSYKKLYKTEDQAIKIMDFMREAGQLALTKRRTIRVDIDISNPGAPVVRMAAIRGNRYSGKGHAAWNPFKEVRMDVAADRRGCPTPPNYADAPFSSPVFGRSIQKRWFGRKLPPGIPISGTLFYGRRKRCLTIPLTTPEAKSEIRAITIFGGSGAVRYWKHDGTRTFRSSMEAGEI